MNRLRYMFRAAFALLVLAGVGVFAKGEGHDNSKTAAMHKTLDCARCHQVVASLTGVQPGPQPMQQCQSCHPPASLANGPLGQSFHASSTRACSDCHSFHETSRITAAGREFQLSKSSGSALCAACHTPGSSVAGLSPGHIAAARLYHSNNEALSGLSASQACLVCHSENRMVQIDGIELSAVPRFSEQHTHPVGEVRNSNIRSGGSTIRQKFDQRLRLYNGRMECQTCHQLTAQTRHRLVPFETPQALCNGCHDLD